MNNTDDVIYDVSLLEADSAVYRNIKLKDEKIISLLRDKPEKERFISLARFIGFTPQKDKEDVITLVNLGAVRYNTEEDTYYLTKANNKIYYYDGKSTYYFDINGSKKISHANKYIVNKDEMIKDCLN